MYIRVPGGLGKAPTPLTPGGGIVPCEGTSAPRASLLWRTPNPRGIACIGENLVVVNRETGEIHQFNLGTGSVRRIWSGPLNEFRPFVGPTYIPRRKELIVSALGRDKFEDQPRRPGTLFAVSLDGTHRVIADQNSSPAHRVALDGCAGTALLDTGEIAVSGFWSRRVSAINPANGATRLLVDLSPDRNPDGLRLHSKGELLICDRTKGELLALRDGGQCRVLARGFLDPISVDVTRDLDAVVLSKQISTVHRLDLNKRLEALSCQPIAAAPAFGRFCLAISYRRKDKVIIAVDSDTNNTLDGLYWL